MVRIVVEIDGLKQLSCIFPQYTEQLLKRVEQIFLSHGFKAAGGRGSYLVYQCSQSEVETTALLSDGIEKCDQYLRNSKRRWSGYSMYVFFDEAEEQEIELQDIAAEMYRLPEHDGIWLDERAARILGERFVISAQDGMYRIVAGDKVRRREMKSFDDYFSDLTLLEECMESFAPLLQSTEPAAFLLRGYDPRCREKLCAAMVRSIDGSMRRIDWLVIQPSEIDLPPGGMVIHAVHTPFLSFATEYMNAQERRCWRYLEGVLDMPPSEVRDSDGRILFILYLSAYIRYMRSQLLPALMICHRLEEMSPAQKEFLADICRRFVEYEAFLPVFTSGEELPEEIEEPCTVAVFDCDRRDNGGTEEREKESEKGRRLSTFFLHYCRKELNRQSKDRSSKAILRAFFSSLPEEHMLITYALSYFGTIFPAEYRSGLSSALGLEQEEMNVALRELENYGVLVHDREISIQPVEIVRPLGEYVREKRDYVRSVCARLIPELRNYLSAEKRREYIRRAIELEREEEAAQVLWELLEENLFSSFDSGILDTMETVLQSAGTAWSRLLSSELLETVRLEAYLRIGDHEEAKKRFRKLFREEDSHKQAPQTAYQLAVAGEYLWRTRAPEEALPYAKKALLGIQDTDNLPRILQALILIGKIMLSLGRVDEALEYFRSAKGYTLEGPPAALDLESSAFIALTHFVLGDYSLALEYIRSAREKAALFGRREWERYLLMLEGKLQFELGRYAEASLLFQELLSGEVLYFDGAREQLFAAWLYRSLVYRGYTGEGIRRLRQLEKTPEVLLFTAEGYILDRDLETASEMTAKAIEERAKERWNFIPAAEHLATDGFVCFENYLLQGEEDNDLLLRHVKALHGFLSFNLGSNEEAERMFDEVLGDKQALRLDPHRHVYYFFRTLSFPEQNAEENVQKLTLLSKAWQNLQKRAGRINDPEDRRSYLMQNYWNSKLFSMSKENKLV